ncbi:alpha/beta fold hydrolase [Falsiroseomonas sp. HW251]|uniref:alpha/beta fold hydrolase n=1 Tax=Falsiroseomonas sp. HW251 TaxID=3390998 RepID=UPI003D31B0FE
MSGPGQPRDAVAHSSAKLPTGVRLHVAEAGPADGEAVLLLHGWPQTWFAWRRVMPILAAAGMRCIAPDLRGFGASSKPAGGYDKKTVAADLLALLDHLGAARAWVVGHDMGAQVAYPFAAQWPTRTHGLVFIEGGLPGFGQERGMDVAAGGSWHFGFNRAGDIAEALVRGREHLFIRHMIRRETVGVFDPTAIGEEDIAVYAAAAAAPGGLRGMFAHYEALIPQDRDDNLRFGAEKLALPVMAVGADHGYAEGSLNTMRKVAQDPVGWIARDCGHYVPEERPAELAAALLAFFRGEPPA